jgi:hypothetical protein
MTCRRVSDCSSSSSSCESSYNISFPDYWYYGQYPIKLHVTEVNESIVLMHTDNSSNSYALTRIHEDLWHVSATRTDIWNFTSYNNSYYERHKDSWHRLANYLWG